MFPLFFLATILSITSPTIIFVIFSTPMRSHRCFTEENSSGREITSREWAKLDLDTTSFPRILEYINFSNIILSHDRQRSYYENVWPWTNRRLRLFMIKINICCWLLDYTKGVSCYSCTDYSLFHISRIFLFKKLYIDSASRGVSDLCTK